VLGNQIYIQRAGLPAPLITRLTRLAAFQNPEFYAAQRMRLSTFEKPRIISCADLFPQHLALPRGCLAEVCAMLSGLGIRFEIRDERRLGTPIDVRVDARKQAAARPFDHQVIFRRTDFQFKRNACDDKPLIHELYAALAADRQRNDMT
jgi:hypothetical protein